MRIVTSILIAFVLVGIAGSASARTPTPTTTPTPTPAVTLAPPTFTPSPAQFSTFEGQCWLDARPCNGQTVSARINGAVCVSPASYSYVPPDADQVLFVLKVPSKDVTPGCGSEGATVQFFVGDRAVGQPSVWHAGATEIRAFVVGFPFAHFAGALRIDRRLSNESLVPYVGGNLCGYGVFGPPPYGYGAEVFSNEQQPGCGTEGAQITFKLLDAQGNVAGVAREKGNWHAWGGLSGPQQLDLTFGPAGSITMPGTGSGGASLDGGTPWARLPVVLELVGLAAAALGLALRRRATTR